MNEPRNDVSGLYKWPGLVILVVGVIHLLLGVFSVIAGDDFNRTMLEWLQQHDPDLDVSSFPTSRGLVFDALHLLIAVLTAAGGYMMMQGRSWGLALTAAILTMVPCLGPCCGLFLPVGIWAVIVLMKPEVKRAFQSVVPHEPI